ncbi:MAG TPA: hypothetical protein VFU23_11970, partial [Gemmatimonadales bacterium]|nr:hypothetical protein [Gemmatimonadales bacterium]
RSGGFTGAVTLAVTGAPGGVTAIVSDQQTSGAVTTATITISADLSTPLGASVLVVHAGGNGVTEATANILTVIVTAASSGTSVSVSSAACPAAQKPIWAAVQNGTAPFQVVTPVNEVYSFTVDAGRGAFAYLVRSTGSSQVVQMQMSQAEWTAGAITLCPAPGTKTINVTVAGLNAGEIATIGLGGGAGFVISPATLTQLTSVQSGAHDVVGYARPIAGAGGNRGYLLRDQDVPDLGALTVDFSGPQPPGFTPVSAAMTVTGLGGAESLSHGMFYHTGAGCDPATLYAGAPPSAPGGFTAFGVPAAIQRPGDRHGLFVSGTLAPRFRSVIEYFNLFGARSVALPSAMPAPALSELGTAYSRRRVQLTLPADLAGSLAFQYTQNGTQKTAKLIVSQSFLAGLAVDVVLGDFTDLAGWDPTAAPGVGAPADYSLTATSSNATGSLCSGTGVRVLTSSFAGTG